MGAGTRAVVRIIAPVALDALAKAASALITGDTIYSTAQVGGPSETIRTATFKYCETHFADQYGYFYEGMRSQPTNGGPPFAAEEDMFVWDSHNGVKDIDIYLQKVFKGSMRATDAIEVSDMLATLFQDRFTEQSLEWTPFSKRLHFSDGVIVDCYMVTAAARDVKDQPAGVGTYCLIAYRPEPK
ncbi:MAG TPA: hypothetical protein VGO80_12595 [Solirubrobacteraceae bacterium]|jgi:hypothetical protein|nr:hypothetical protein [Solirubrobacteraceae bacterium]